ncbi:SDR family oxidoreductase [Longispora sp. NPDC051575]|uniref:SDR family NAD(P)-dependent oxidoreductase n=1 Tax=Longispora sp. NPDC051575 TaxID=3154943 RepID=UPI003429DB8B
MSTCLVTGAGRGIGRAVAVALSAAGHSVALTARNMGELTETAALCTGPTLVVPADITTDIEDVFEQVEKGFGPVEILVANAGGASTSPLAKITDADWQAMLDLNLTAPFRCVRRAVPAMVDGGYGRIVVIASVASKIGEPYIAAYTAAKHGVLGLVRSAAAELARTGVTVNAVCPGYVDTPMTDQSVAAIVAKTGRTAEEARQVLARKQPTGKLITVEEVTAAVLYCVGNGAVTGQALNVDGGAVQS